MGKCFDKQTAAIILTTLYLNNTKKEHLYDALLPLLRNLLPSKKQAVSGIFLSLPEEPLAFDHGNEWA